ncbi:alpha/beta hydrolase fold domain-containing protein [Rhodococcoides yunnanense]|uniref:Alpha/beta hydrolase fold domain-containing protein n=1 Tax=Rhodococcoides yunnanense TaxID=278209 RepID=A0ABU4B6K2_9NOCA|nr:alpha/beta hydrolase fold domain-containing protein [Rhodococcus yunnanensis]MDV6259817.1 alpha/beta hydrolase fold domain-containing protein [Rhodococcus yunnanensis]
MSAFSDRPVEFATNDRPSTTMRIAATVLSARARRGESRPVALDAERRTLDRITSWVPVPSGITLTDEKLGGVPVTRLTSGSGARGVVMYLHGGAYVLGNARQALAVAGLCENGGPDLVSVEYRLAPEHPFPAAVDDAIAVYRALIESVGADRIVVVGESAGGGLLLLLLQRALREGLPMPLAAAPAFPWADLSMSGDSTRSNLGRDMLKLSDLVQGASWFAGDRDAADPELSPLFGSFRGFPRTVISVGTRDLLFDDARRVTKAMEADGVDVTLVEWPGAIHGFTAVPIAEGKLHAQQMRTFIDAVFDAESLANIVAVQRPTVSTGRRRYAAIGYAVRAMKALPTPLREHLLAASANGVGNALPPVSDLVRLLEAAGGLPDGRLWQNHLVDENPHLRGVRLRDITSDTNGRLRARLYLPPADAPPATGGFVWVHGGAFLIGSLDQKEAHWPAMELASQGIPVLSVDYRMCLNGTAYPAPLDDVMTAWGWAVTHAEDMGVGPSDLHLGGGSAGACLVAGAALRLRDRDEPMPASLFLGYPVLQAALPAATEDAVADLAGHTVISDEWARDMVQHWAGNSSTNDPYISPGLAELHGLPPTFVLSCGRDSLRRASEPFALRLAGEGVSVVHELFTDSEHAPLDRPGTADGELAISRLRTWITGGPVAMHESTSGN